MADRVTREIEEIGPVLFERSRKARHLNISVRPYKGVRVAVPRSVSFKKAEEIVRTKIAWIKKHKERIAEVERSHRDVLDQVARIDRREAKRKLIARLNQLSGKHNLPYNRVFIRNQKTRLGSCSSANNINLNMKLVLLPDELIDYVILHELVHTKIKSHNRDFYAALDHLTGDAKGLRKWLKKYSLGMM